MILLFSSYLIMEIICLDFIFFSILRRCFYGKDSFEYNFEYFKQFWINYQNNRKYFRLDFIDAHEGTGEVIKYLDQPLFNFLNRF